MEEMSKPAMETIADYNQKSWLKITAPRKKKVTA